jgi:hypothetical protein
MIMENIDVINFILHFPMYAAYIIILIASYLFACMTVAFMSYADSGSARIKKVKRVN